jgi:antitoxin component YwqK of YwqJK toxin-antitoxin module
VTIGNYNKGLQHGLWMDYYENGALKDSGYYADGRMNGSWTYWYENGNLASNSIFKSNLQHGLWKDYYDNGKIKSEGRLAEGKMIGDWKSYYPTGQLREEFEYKSNEKLIIKNVWDLDGKLLVKNGNGYYKYFLETGDVIESGKVENGMRVGIWSHFYENGDLQSKGNYENNIFRIKEFWDLRGNLTIENGYGNYRSYYPGEKSVFEKGKIENGYRSGIWRIFDDNSGSVLQELFFIEGKLTGLQKYYYPTGQLYSMGEMVDDLREGEWNWYFESGSISSTVNFKKDKKDGKQTMWEEKGLVITEEYYRNGKILKEE